MARSPKNRLSTADIFISSHFSENRKMKEAKASYLCANYIQAMTMKKTLEIITGEDCRIAKNGTADWKVTIKK